MSLNIKLTSKGQITLPKEIRDQLMLRSGDHLRAQMKDGTIILKPIRENDNMVLMEYAEQYQVHKQGIKKVRAHTEGLKLDMTEYVRKTREEKK